MTSSSAAPSRGSCVPLVVALLGLSASLAMPLAAQQGATLRGRVTDAATGRPLPQAVVVARNLTDNARRYTAITDSLGRYRLSLAAGRYLVAARRIGYGESSRTVELGERSEVELDLELVFVGISLGQITSAQIGSRIFQMSEPNYFVTGLEGTRSSTGAGTTRSLNQVKFRVAVRYQLVSLGNAPESGVHVGYRQNSFWHLYEDSAPFFDNNYNPQAYGYFDSREYSEHPYAPSVILLVQHESNGRDGVASRGWNRYGGGIDIGDPEGSILYGRALVWGTWAVEPTNPDLADYAGRGQLSLYFQPLVRLGHAVSDAGLSVNARLAGRIAVPSIEANLFLKSALLEDVRFLGFTRRLNASFIAQYFEGSAENLLTYDQRRRTIRFGLATVR